MNKPILEKVDLHFSGSFNVKRDILPHILVPWHFHPEFEIVLIEQGTGKRFVGDSIENFKDGDLVVIGPNLPHVWLNDQKYYKNNSKLKTKVIVVHFQKNAFGEKFFSIPEMSAVREMLMRTDRGVVIKGKTYNEVYRKLQLLLKARGTRKLILLLEILETIAKSKKFNYLASIGFSKIFTDFKSERLNKIYTYIYNNFKNNISLNSVAKEAAMSKAAFCKYFKKTTQKTFSEVLNEVRIGYASKLLIENELSVSEISYECGFNNISYFNRIFKRYNKLSPGEYKLQHFKNN